MRRGRLPGLHHLDRLARLLRTRRCAACAARRWPQGWTHFKMKVGQDTRGQPCAAPRSCAGDRPRAPADAWTPTSAGTSTEAIEQMKALAPLRPWWIEEPTSPDDVLGHATIARGDRAHQGRDRRDVPEPRDLQAAAAGRSASAFCQVDACRVGGVNEVLVDPAAWPRSSACPCARTRAASSLCEYVQHLVDLRLHRASAAALEDRVLRVRRPPARALRLPRARRGRALPGPARPRLLGEERKPRSPPTSSRAGRCGAPRARRRTDYSARAPSSGPKARSRRNTSRRDGSRWRSCAGSRCRRRGPRRAPRYLLCAPKAKAARRPQEHRRARSSRSARFAVTRALHAEHDRLRHARARGRPDAQRAQLPRLFNGGVRARVSTTLRVGNVSRVKAILCLRSSVTVKRPAMPSVAAPATSAGTSSSQPETVTGAAAARGASRSLPGSRDRSPAGPAAGRTRRPASSGRRVRCSSCRAAP